MHALMRSLVAHEADVQGVVVGEAVCMCGRVQGDEHYFVDDAHISLISLPAARKNWAAKNP